MMTATRTILRMVYWGSLAAWLGATPWLGLRAQEWRNMSRTEQAALRGGAPGPCNPQNGECDSDPLGPNGCNLGVQNTCGSASCVTLGQDDTCATNTYFAYNPPQCQGIENYGDGCANVNPPETECVDSYPMCKCKGPMGNLNCTGAASTAYTGTCVTSAPQ